jgi:hypothetical protein
MIDRDTFLFIAIGFFVFAIIWLQLQVSTLAARQRASRLAIARIQALLDREDIREEARHE